jgi:cyclopropane-fatty-acyl-phospholipid synthase
LSYFLALILNFSLTPSVLRNITIGRLRIVTDKCTYGFPERDTDNEEELHGELRVINDAFWVRLCTMGDLGFAEAYMFGDVACEDLISTFLVSILAYTLVFLLDVAQIFLKNKDSLTSLNSTFSWLFSLPQRLTSFRFLNSLGNSRSNISAHYDLSDDMFRGLYIFWVSCDRGLDDCFHIPSLFIRRHDLLVCRLF